MTEEATAERSTSNVQSEVVSDQTKYLLLASAAQLRLARALIASRIVKAALLLDFRRSLARARLGAD